MLKYFKHVNYPVINNWEIINNAKNLVFTQFNETVYHFREYIKCHLLRISKVSVLVQNSPVTC